MTSTRLAGGQALHLQEQPVEGWNAKPAGQNLSMIDLEVMIRTAPGVPPFPGASTARILLRMNAAIAEELYHELEVVGRSQGWLP